MGLTSIIYKKLGQVTVSDKFLKKKYKGLLPHIELIKNDNIASLNFIGKSQTRGHATAKMITDCLKQITTNKDLHFRFFINDKPLAGYDENCFYYCINDESKKGYLFPDFAFESWSEAGITNFSDTVKQIEEHGKSNWIDNRLFWIGNVQTNKIRSKLLEIGLENNSVFHFQDTYVDNFVLHKKDVPYLSLPDHTKYKYLLDIEGNSYSARLKFLFFSQRVLFIQDRSWKEYFHYKLKPYEHFIPVKNDLSDLQQQYEMIENDATLYQKIVANALTFAHEHLTYNAAISYMVEAINKRIKNL
ncbi:glycosyl transferase family 90 [Pedobacter borealis]|uniref:glycosyl transferase family 90 n=1 Tax=Pedobacter borealis TaxID=475254 RepID=UPI0004936621|nr:glycosyl transferase family 90 [Pedobacter borealis]